jgi:hypothetical protein
VSMAIEYVFRLVAIVIVAPGAVSVAPIYCNSLCFAENNTKRGDDFKPRISIGGLLLELTAGLLG